MSHRAPQHAAPRRGRTTPVLTAVTAASVFLGAMVSVAPAQAAPRDIVPVSAGSRTADAQSLLTQINAYRSSRGLAPVKYSARISGIAQGQSDRLVNHEVINHSNTFLTDPRAAGYRAAGEIHAISWRYSVTDLMTWWKGSPAHNKVLTDPRITVIGVGLTYVDGSLAGDGSGWRLVGTVAAYGFPTGGGPADASVTVTGNQSGAVTSRPVAASPVTPATYALKGVIASRYHAAGGRPVLGNPVHNERGGLVQGGTYQSFRGPGTAVHKILWSPATGAHVVQESGAIGNAWKRADYERGWGYPLGPEHRVGTEMRQYFSNGYVAHWSSITRKTWVTR